MPTALRENTILTSCKPKLNCTTCFFDLKSHLFTRNSAKSGSEITGQDFVIRKRYLNVCVLKGKSCSLEGLGSLGDIWALLHFQHRVNITLIMECGPGINLMGSYIS